MLKFNSIYCGDCLELLKQVPDGSIDFVLCDLPYGITNCDFDVKIDLQKFWQEIFRVTKFNAACAMFAKGKFLIELANSNLKYYRYKWVWQKNLATGFLNAKKMPLCAHEDILMFYRKLPTYNPQFTKGKPYNPAMREGKSLTKNCYHHHLTVGIRQNKIITERNPQDIIFSKTLKRGFENHPTEKPVELLEYLIKTYSNVGEVVLDATIGAGSTAVACVNTGRQFIGFELDEHYFDIACDRIRQAEDKKNQLSLC